MDLSTLSDAELTVGLQQAVLNETAAMSNVLRHLEEFEERKLWAKAGCTSLFAYCTKVLHYSEDEAGKRIYAARSAMKYPLTYGLLDERRIHLTTVTKLASHLTTENNETLLRRAAGLKALEIDSLVAGLAPQPAKLGEIVEEALEHLLDAKDPDRLFNKPGRGPRGG